MAQVKWLWEHRRWRGGICRSDLGGKALTLWIMMLIFGGVAAGIVYKSPQMIHFAKVRWEVLIPGGFAFGGLIFMMAALIATARWLRFGGCCVRMRTVPGVIGGHFSGAVLLPETFPAHTDVRLELVCETTTTTPGAKHDDSDTVFVHRDWEHTVRVTANAAYCHDGHCIIPFDFTVPYGLPDETASRMEGKLRIVVRWKLRVFAQMSGPDLDITYRVPVFQTVASDPVVKGAMGTEQNLDDFLRDSGTQRRVRVEHVQGVTTYICDVRGMKKGFAAGPTIFGLVCLAGAVIIICNTLPMQLKYLLMKAEGWENLFRLTPLIFLLGVCMMTGMLGLFGLLLLCMGGRGFISRRTWIQNGMLYQHACLFGIPWTRRCPCHSVADVHHRDVTSSGGKTWYAVVIERNTSPRRQRNPLYLLKRITVATDVATVREAAEIEQRLRADLHLSVAAE